MSMLRHVFACVLGWITVTCAGTDRPLIPLIHLIPKYTHQQIKNILKILNSVLAYENAKTYFCLRFGMDHVYMCWHRPTTDIPDPSHTQIDSLVYDIHSPVYQYSSYLKLNAIMLLLWHVTCFKSIYFWLSNIIIQMSVFLIFPSINVTYM